MTIIRPRRQKGHVAKGRRWGCSLLPVRLFASPSGTSCILTLICILGYTSIFREARKRARFAYWTPRSCYFFFCRDHGGTSRLWSWETELGQKVFKELVVLDIAVRSLVEDVFDQSRLKYESTSTRENRFCKIAERKNNFYLSATLAILNV